MTPAEANDLLTRHGFDGTVLTPSRYVESNDIQWVSYANANSGFKVCMYATTPCWSGWEDRWEDAFNVAFARYLVATRKG